MAQPLRTASTDSASDAIRKRVCKACDRCRLKKSKCDGSHPCSRCKADNAICVFGERKKSHDKVYPKGYVEMLEQQQSQLVSGLQEMYHRMHAGESWPGPSLSEANGHPLTHDILAALGLLEPKGDGSGEMETFEDDCQKLQSRLLADGAGYVKRRDSFSSDSDHSQRGHTRSTAHTTPNLVKQTLFDKNFTFSASPSPVTQSPIPRKRQSYPPAQQSLLHRSTPITNDPQLYEPEFSMPGFNDPAAMMASKFAVQNPQFPQILDEDTDMLTGGKWDDSTGQFDMNMGLFYPQQLSNGFESFPNMPDLPTIHPMGLDPDFERFIAVQT